MKIKLVKFINIKCKIKLVNKVKEVYNIKLINLSYEDVIMY